MDEEPLVQTGLCLSGWNGERALYQSRHRPGQRRAMGARPGRSSAEQEPLAAESHVQSLSGLFRTELK